MKIGVAVVQTICMYHQMNCRLLIDVVYEYMHTVRVCPNVLLLATTHSTTGLVVKSNVAIVGPRVRFAGSALLLSAGAARESRLSRPARVFHNTIPKGLGDVVAGLSR
jgi:hypothetical protein